MLATIIIRTSESEKLIDLLNRENINYEIYQEPPEKIFADYGVALLN